MQCNWGCSELSRVLQLTRERQGGMGIVDCSLTSGDAWRRVEWDEAGSVSAFSLWEGSLEGGNCVAASLRHPHIVTIYDAGEDEQMLYITMEYVVGSDLSDVIKQRTVAGELSRSSSRSPPRSARRTPAAWCIATSSPRTC